MIRTGVWGTVVVVGLIVVVAEVVVVEQAVVGMAPSQQRLDAEDSLVLELHLRLVVELELPAGQRAANLAQKLQARGVKLAS